jgi:hypothetical protein
MKEKYKVEIQKDGEKIGECSLVSKYIEQGRPEHVKSAANYLNQKFDLEGADTIIIDTGEEELRENTKKGDISEQLIKMLGLN